MVLAPGTLLAQQAQEVLVNMRRAYQEETAVYLKRNTVYRIERTADGTKAFQDVEEDQLILKDETGTAQEQSVHYSNMVPLERLEAYTLAINGKGYKRIQASRIDHRDQRGRNNFHDDLRVASFTLPSLTSGSIGHVAYTIQYPDARFASGHFFGYAYPTEESTLTVISDPGIEVEVRMFNVADSLLTRTVSKEKGRTVQRFTMRHIPAIRFESNAPSIYYYAPHAQLVVQEAGMNDTVSYTGNLYKWYAQHVKDSFGEVPASVKALSDSLVAGLTDPAERAAHLYRWVQDRIQYVAFEDGMNGFIPAKADEVCQARYGDCKGMSNLLRSMLLSAGLEAHLCWVGTRSLPYTYESLPTTANSDHMIVALELPDTTLFLDPTSAHSAFGVPSGFTQGKEALIGIDSEHYRIQRIPVMPATYSTITDSISGHLESANFVGSGRVRFTGYERQGISDVLRNYTAEKRLQFMRQVLMKGSNAFQLDSIRVEGLDDREAPLSVFYSFRIPDLAREVSEKRFVPLTLSDPWKPLRVHEDRKLPIRFDHCSTETYIVGLDLPTGGQVSGVPAPFEGGTENFSIHVDHDLAANSITSTTIFRTEELIVDKDMSAWRQLNTAYLKERGRSLVIQIP